MRIAVLAYDTYGNVVDALFKQSFGDVVNAWRILIRCGAYKFSVDIHRVGIDYASKAYYAGLSAIDAGRVTFFLSQ